MSLSDLGLFLATLMLLGLADTAAAGQRWIHPRCQKLASPHGGPFVRLADGSVLAVHNSQALVSKDDGKTWDARPMFKDGTATYACGGGAMVRTRDDVVILAFMNGKEVQRGKWLFHDRKAMAQWQLPVYVTRSLDEGRTWETPQKLQDGWCGALTTMVQTRSGRVVFASQKLIPDPGRHAVMTYASDDQGKTWRQSNTIDLGGCGHHDGACEATLVELKDTRLWMLLRTSLDRFWEAFSTDGGLSWRIVQPSSIDASSSPGMLQRLASGRLVLVWNRLYPEGKAAYERRSGDYSAVAASWHREELAIAFSDDDGKTWSKPVVIAREPGKWLSYPHVYEHRPGELWITTGQGGLRVRLREADFAKP
jgi:sialidase-1